MTAPLRLGTRRSALATAQAQRVADALTARTGRAVELVEVTTYGDTSSAALSQIGGTGVFVSALREALLAGEVDLAVHSLKDLPTAPPEGLALAAVPLREDPRDVLVARDGLTLGELPPGATDRHRLAAPGRPAARPRPRPRGRRRSAATSTPGSGWSPTGPSTPSSWRGPGWPASAGSTRSPRCSTRSRCSPPPARAPGGRVPMAHDASSTTTLDLLGALDDAATRLAVTPSEPCSPLSRPAAPPLSGPTAKPPTRSPASRNPSCTCVPSSAPSTAPRRSGCPPPDLSARHHGSVATSRPSCSPKVRPISCGSASSDPPELRQEEARQAVGSVAFVGAGPGDPGLLTVRAVELLARADVVVTESQDDAFVRRFCRPDVEVVDGSLGDDGQPLSHAVRARLVVKAAKSGGLVVRLLDGDPFLDATGSEEAAGCAKAGIPFEVVPGVSSIAAVPAYAGIPLTSAKHREVRVVDVAEGSVDWSSLGEGTATLVLLSATKLIGDVAKALVAAGRAPETPVAVTRGGTTTEQRTVTSTLERIAADVKAAKLAPPTITVVGDTVTLRDQLSWFETKPLFGWRVLVPRTKEQAGALSEQLRAATAPCPTRCRPSRSSRRAPRSRWSAPSRAWSPAATSGSPSPRATRSRPCARSSRSTASTPARSPASRSPRSASRPRPTLLAFGIKPDLVPSGEQSAAGLLEDWPPYDPVFDPIDRVFLPRADIATETLVAGLVELGWEVDDVTAYRTVRAAPPAAPIREAIKSGGFDAVLFTSSSTVRNLVGIAGKPHASTVIACIGPATAKTAEEHGLRVDVLAPTPSVAALAEALAEYGASLRSSAVAAGEPVLRPSQKRATARRKAT